MGDDDLYEGDSITQLLFLQTQQLFMAGLEANSIGQFHEMVTLKRHWNQVFLL